MTIAETIDHTARAYSPTHAYWLARAASLAYQEEADVADQAQRWGFDRMRHHLSRHEPPFPLEARTLTVRGVSLCVHRLGGALALRSFAAIWNGTRV